MREMLHARSGRARGPAPLGNRGCRVDRLLQRALIAEVRGIGWL